MLKSEVHLKRFNSKFPFVWKTRVLTSDDVCQCRKTSCFVSESSCSVRKCLQTSKQMSDCLRLSKMSFCTYPMLFNRQNQILSEVTQIVCQSFVLADARTVELMATKQPSSRPGLGCSERSACTVVFAWLITVLLSQYRAFVVRSKRKGSKLPIQH